MNMLSVKPKRTWPLRFYNHYKRIRAEFSRSDVRSENNILLIDRCGKTYLAGKRWEVLNVPFAMPTATSLTEAGYVGEDVENIL